MFFIFSMFSMFPMFSHPGWLDYPICGALFCVTQFCSKAFCIIQLNARCGGKCTKKIRGVVFKILKYSLCV